VQQGLVHSYFSSSRLNVPDQIFCIGIGLLGLGVERCFFFLCNTDKKQKYWSGVFVTNRRDDYSDFSLTHGSISHFSSNSIRNSGDDV
jgi:hypothetical protein